MYFCDYNSNNWGLNYKGCRYTSVTALLLLQAAMGVAIVVDLGKGFLYS